MLIDMSVIKGCMVNWCGKFVLMLFVVGCISKIPPAKKEHSITTNSLLET